ncbi:hypothetical protein ONS95_011726 [Cadophora gregata]|uniref:uncharacterized protein n=1 Tax=Cadophora gregata TaxID=51156 RepID=UPI0026DD5C93|nr:uncharacterized protein ONS95_011726 [Cadophora gregata]KAK0120320.1 hypothetical protein ONS95_011726 [Cadophora gregata]
MSGPRLQRGGSATLEKGFADERRRAQAEYQLKLQRQEHARRQAEYDRAQQLQAQKGLAVEGSSAAKPTASSFERCRKVIREPWRNASPGIQVVLTVSGSFMIWMFVSHLYRLTFGIYFYSTAYLWAYNGLDFPMYGCYRFRESKEGFLTWGQSHQSYFQGMRCWGYFNALDLDGDLSPPGRLLATLVLDPLASSPTLYLLCIALFVWKVLPRITKRLRALTGYVWHADRPFWAKVIYIWLLVTLLYLQANNLGTLAVLGGLCFVSAIVIYVIIDAFFNHRLKTAWEAASDNMLVGPVLEIISWIWNTASSFWTAWKIPPRAVETPKKRYHIDVCDCYNEKNRQIDDLNNTNTALQSAAQVLQANLDAKERLLENAKTNLDLVSGERDKVEARLSGPLPSPGHWHAPRHDDARSTYWERMYNERDSEYLQLVNQKWEQENAYKTELEKLQKSINHSQGAELDREDAVKALYEAKATIRNLEREHDALSVIGMNLRQKLAEEKETHSEKCKNEAGCQRRIRELEENYDRAMAHIREDQTLVTEACVALGMHRKEAEHVQLRAYLADVTIQVAKLYAMGVRGADTTDLQVEIMRKEVAREATYKNRLEREVERLGGNILDIRIGLDTTRPQDWKVDFITYEQNLLRIFPIYQRLWNAINDMYGVFTREQLLPPGWTSQPSRNNMSSNILSLPPPEAALHLVKTNEVTNPHLESFEVLVEKLVWKECMRLYNHGLEMLMLLDSNMTSHATIEGIDGVNKILNEVLHEVLDHIPALLANHPTERALSPRKQKKYEIYSAMQTAIAGLLIQVIANKRMPPDWLSTQAYDDRFNKQYDSPENLIANLCNLEMTILAKRIHQLVAFTEEYHFPGTRAGPPRAEVQHDPTYIKRWDHLVIARTFAELTISHWNLHKSQKEILHTDEAGRRLIRFEPNPQLLPLNVDKFRVAVGLLPLQKEEKSWPEEWRARMVNDPSSGPCIIFEPPSSADQQPKITEHAATNIKNNNTNTSICTNDNTQLAVVGTSKEIERKRLQNEWNERRERCIQLYNHVVAYGIKNHIPRLMDANLRINADPKSMKRDIENFKEAENQYVHALTGGPKKYPVPPMRKKGGKMDPFQ